MNWKVSVIYYLKESLEKMQILLIFLLKKKEELMALYMEVTQEKLEIIYRYQINFLSLTLQKMKIG